VKPLLNTLYVTTEGTSLRKDGENLVADLAGEERARVPFHMLQSVVVFGAVYLSPPLIGACAAAGISIALLDRAGRFEARIEGPVTGNVLLRKAQYRASDRPGPIVRSILVGKLSNQRTVLMRALRDHRGDLAEADSGRLAAVARRLAMILRGLASDLPLEAMRGSEGEAANLYFSVFDLLVRSHDPGMRFRGRSRRPPLDPVNAVLSFVYSLLTHDCRSALEGVGLDPAVGFLHRDRPGRPSLALDLMEELRPVLADRLVLSLLNRGQLGAADFEARDGGAVWLSETGRKTVLVAWQERKRVERRHPFLGESAPLGLVPHLQAQLLARHLRGDLDAYPPYLWK
jgi:CRISPR-associated protein Cas1